MRIAIDVTPLSHPRTGIGNYVRGMVAGLVEANDGSHEIVCFGPVRAGARSLVVDALAGLDVELAIWRVRASHQLRQAWSRLAWPPVERLLGPVDVVHFSDWMFPPQRSGVRATTVHDLVPLRFPELTTRRTVAMHSRKYAHAAATCDVVFANSRATATDVVRRLGLPDERVRVAYPPIAPTFRPDGPRADLGAPYVLAVGTIEPRKGLDDLLRAFAELRRSRPDVVLAIAGSRGWGDPLRPAGDAVTMLGYVSDERLAELYRGASVLAFPSRFEGFGMPVAEALASATPVVASSDPSLDEAAGEACLRADPADPVAFAATLETALAGDAPDPALGLGHAGRFRPRACGEAVLAGYLAARERRG